jgi:Glyoxalase-like domain
VARGIDHLVVAVRDLDLAGRLYERMGFRVGARNRHPWGTENRIVQLPGTFIELVTAGQEAEIPPRRGRTYSFGAFVRDYLARREGLAMLALDSGNATADATRFARAGIGSFDPFFFERKGARPDGTATHVAFTLAFAEDAAAPRMGFFACQHHHPENFWNPAFEDHPNRAVSVSTVAMAAPDPLRHERFLALFTGGGSVRPSGHDLSFALARGRLDVMTLDDAGEIYGSVEEEPGEPCFVGFGVRIAALERQAGELSVAGVPYQRIGSRLVVPASAALGVAVAFEPI